jgi:hypothetical protein
VLPIPIFKASTRAPSEESQFIDLHATKRYFQYKMLCSVVAISVSLLWSTADCFSPMMVPPSSVRPSTFEPVELQSQSLRRRRTSTTPWPRLFAGGVSNESSSSSSERSTKVREMASFLAMQLLEKAMQETGKEDGKSKMEMEDVQKLAETLQTMSVTKQAQDEVESTWKAAGEAVEEKKLLNVEEPETSSSMEEETLSAESSAPPASKEQELDEAVLLDAMAAESEKLASAEEEEEEEAPLNIESIDESSEGDSSSQVTDESVPVHEEDIEEELIQDDVKPAAETSIEQEAEPVVLEKEEDAEASAEAFESLLSEPDTAATAGVMARFPDIVSKDFGRSLDVEASDIPPLRDSSKPKRKAEQSETVADTAPTPETVDGSIVETALTEETTEEVEAPSVEESQSETAEPEDVASSVSDESISEEENDEDAGQAETVDSEEVDAQMQEEVEEPVVLDETDSVDGATEAEEATLGSLATEADTQGNAGDEIIVSESSDSEEDAEESPEEATTIQEDETEVPAAQENEKDGRVAADPESGKDAEDQDSPEVSTAQESETETPAIATPESADSTSSTQGKFLQGIRNFFPFKRKQPSLTVVHESLPITITVPGLIRREDLILEARKQPKSPEEEAKLAAKYGSLSIEDRAFAILTDLGMVEMNPDPNDPNYDHLQDDEYCEN